MFKKFCRGFYYNHIYHNKKLILGIETSCDDTSLALLTYPDGDIIGTSHKSQQAFHSFTGGINPIFARDFHEINIEKCFSEIEIKLINYLKSQNIYISNDNYHIWKNLMAIAVTTKPGLPLSLEIGIETAKRISSLVMPPIPIIPIHHMEAHALTPRIPETVSNLSPKNQLKFPYLCLLISGGHCLLVWVKDVSDFYIIGNTKDIAPGDAYDKISRKLGLNYDMRFNGMSGGKSIDTIISNISNNLKIKNNIINPMSNYVSCDFSFNGLLSTFLNLIDQCQLKYKNECDDFISDDYNESPIIKNNSFVEYYKKQLNGITNYQDYSKNSLYIQNLYDFSKALIATYFQQILTEHIMQKTIRAFVYCEKHLIPFINEVPVYNFAVSGGVASNNYIRTSLQKLCQTWKWNLHIPDPELCTDNGVMIAWNAIEKIKSLTNKNQNICDYDLLIKKINEFVPDLNIQNKSSFGISIVEDVTIANLKNRIIKSHMLDKNNIQKIMKVE
ncbi:unnamed protein product [Gordionus sp. m RMFG-2023]|uniref:tRNA N6-adenosine threonylcarbamoyltransferase, mitochondrial-like n=1 Tax=Gordionus sp. m RMFG-2023 TaxID=3053472 RepID=UPI0030E372B6